MSLSLYALANVRSAEFGENKGRENTHPNVNVLLQLWVHSCNFLSTQRSISFLQSQRIFCMNTRNPPSSKWLIFNKTMSFCQCGRPWPNGMRFIVVQLGMDAKSRTHGGGQGFVPPETWPGVEPWQGRFVLSMKSIFGRDI